METDKRSLGFRKLRILNETRKVERDLIAYTIIVKRHNAEWKLEETKASKGKPNKLHALRTEREALKQKKTELDYANGLLKMALKVVNVQLEKAN